MPRNTQGPRLPPEARRGVGQTCVSRALRLCSGLSPVEVRAGRGDSGDSDVVGEGWAEQCLRRTERGLGGGGVDSHLQAVAGGEMGT